MIYLVLSLCSLAFLFCRLMWGSGGSHCLVGEGCLGFLIASVCQGSFVLIWTLLCLCVGLGFHLLDIFSLYRGSFFVHRGCNLIDSPVKYVCLSKIVEIGDQCIRVGNVEMKISYLRARYHQKIYFVIMGFSFYYQYVFKIIYQNSFMILVS